MDRANKRSAAVLPRVGAVYRSPAAVAAPCSRSIVARPVNMTPRRFNPCRGEGGLELLNCRPLEADVGLAPGTAVAAVPEPLVIDTEPAGPADAAIDNDAAHA